MTNLYADKLANMMRAARAEYKKARARERRARKNLEHSTAYRRHRMALMDIDDARKVVMRIEQLARDNGFIVLPESDHDGD